MMFRKVIKRKNGSAKQQSMGLKNLEKFISSKNATTSLDYAVKYKIINRDSVVY
jgi:regulator of protease activity HflC (stomatin/prohibitin superfamily)